MKVWILYYEDIILNVCSTLLKAEELRDWEDAKSEEVARNYWLRNNFSEEVNGTLQETIKSFLKKLEIEELEVV